MTDFLEITRSAKQIDVDRAFRKRSRALHPDKARQSLIAARATAKPKSTPGAQPSVHSNKPPTDKDIKAAEKSASERFTRLGLIAEILKDDRRRSYDHFLDNGFPSWRGTGYYYSRFRPGLFSTLVGLFMFGGGVLHYIVLVLGYKRQKEFVERYIRQARQAAWGNTSAAAGIPGLSDAALGDGEEAPQEEQPLSEAVTRRERRAQEKESKKKNKDNKTLKPVRGNGNGRSGTHTPAASEGEEGASSDPSVPVPGARKRIQAENGKVLVVDRVGSVFLEEEDEETEETSLLLLDPNEIEKPTFKQTFLYRLPIWVLQVARDKVSAGTKGVEEKAAGEDVQGGAVSNTIDALDSASMTKSRKRKGRK